jgi:hypothetical protein
MIEVKAPALKDAIGSLRKAIGNLDVLQIKAANKEKLLLSSRLEGAVGAITVPAVIDKSAHFAVDADILLKLCVGRGDIVLMPEGNEVKFKGRGNYQGSFTTQPIEDIIVFNAKMEKQDTDYFGYLARHYLPKIQLSNIKDNGAALALMLRGDGHILKLAVTDMLHLGLIIAHNRLVINQNIPLNYTAQLSAMLKDGGGYALRNNRLFCWNHELDASLPLTSDLIESWSVVGAMEALTNPLVSLQIDVMELRKVCHNLSAVYSGSNSIVFTIGKEGLGLSCKGDNGTVKDVLPVSYNIAQNLEVNMSMSLLMDVLDGPLQTGIATISFYKNNAALVMAIEAIAPDNNSKLTYYLLALAPSAL